MLTNDVSTMLREVAEEHIRPRFRALAEDEIIEKRPDDLVTIADREAERAIAERLQAADPRALIVGEEATFADPSILAGLPTAERAWLIDPVDGTRNFVNGHDHYAVMVAELRAGMPVRSWILHPEQGEMYVAERGAGVWKDGVRLKPIERKAPFDGAASRSRYLGKQGRDVKPIWPAAWCCGFDYTHILEGRTDFTIYRHAKPWDHIPGQLMLHEVGGIVYDADKVRYRVGAQPDGLVAVANEEVARAVVPVWLSLRRGETPR